ncbi:hypothetical protein JRQ81_010376 [Phrynocephalus forsythii]|uniref:Uncharacterized protein n=1 Tax=Phrynocephalus forsythii TaxID=171643 RepID=A0A9Q1ARU3_9SAUR|nr:hypothetical protein JRQ81_010376 [Phrynocephalus forsythii]
MERSLEEAGQDGDASPVEFTPLQQQQPPPSLGQARASKARQKSSKKESESDPRGGGRHVFSGKRRRSPAAAKGSSRRDGLKSQSRKGDERRRAPDPLAAAVGSSAGGRRSGGCAGCGARRFPRSSEAARPDPVGVRIGCKNKKRRKRRRKTPALSRSPLWALPDPAAQEKRSPRVARIKRPSPGESQARLLAREAMGTLTSGLGL